MSQICIIGAGRVGLATGIAMASLGYKTICVDLDKKKIDSIKKGKISYYEEGLGEQLRFVLEKGTFNASTNVLEAIKVSDVSYVCVGTP